MIDSECAFLIESHDDQLQYGEFTHGKVAPVGDANQAEDKAVDWIHRYRILLVVEKYLSWILEFLNAALTILLLQFGTA